MVVAFLSLSLQYPFTLGNTFASPGESALLNVQRRAFHHGRKIPRGIQKVDLDGLRCKRWSHTSIIGETKTTSTSSNEAVSVAEAEPHAVVDAVVQYLTPDGRAFATTPEGQQIFLPCSSASQLVAPQDNVRARIKGTRRGRVEAWPLEILERKQEVVQPQCEHFGPCSGCFYQHLSYETQLAEKHMQIQRMMDELASAAGRSSSPVPPIIPCPDRYHYRTKMSFGFRSKASPEEPGDSFLGYPAAEGFDKVVPIQSCPVQLGTGDRIVRRVRELCEELGLKAFEKKRGTALDLESLNIMHTLSLRCSHYRGEEEEEWMVDVVTSRNEEVLLRQLSDRLVATVPEVVSVVANIKVSPLHPNWWSQTAMHSNESELMPQLKEALHGDPWLPFRVCDLTFLVGPNTFISNNIGQSAVVYEMIRDIVMAKKPSRVLDLYCGAGFSTLTIAAALPDTPVVGVDISGAAIRDAVTNAELNGITNASFKQGDVGYVLHNSRDTASPLLVLMPPRSGLAHNVSSTLRNTTADTVIYVSNNLLTLQRDLRAMLGSFVVSSIQAVDSCPHSNHMDVVCVLSRTLSRKT